MVDYNIEVAKKGRAPGLGNQAAGAFFVFQAWGNTRNAVMHG